MKQQIISEVVQQMLPHLDNAQMQQLQKVLENALFGCEITAQSEKNETDALTHASTRESQKAWPTKSKACWTAGYRQKT